VVHSFFQTVLNKWDIILHYCYLDSVGLLVKNIKLAYMAIEFFIETISNTNALKYKDEQVKNED